MTSVSLRQDPKKAIDRLKEIDKAFVILNDPNRRSAYDALDTYNVIQNYAWKKHRLSQPDLKKLEAFWAKQHINNELRKNLNFDNFIPEYDLIWYTPFYQEEYFRTVAEKEKQYLPAEDKIAKTRRSAILTLSASGLLAASGIMALWLSAMTIVAIFLLIAGGLGLISGFLLFKQYKTLKSQTVTAQGVITDKWIKPEPLPFSKSVRFRYFLVFDFFGQKYYQEVDAQTFINGKTGATVEVRYVPDTLDVTPVLVAIAQEEKTDNRQD